MTRTQLLAELKKVLRESVQDPAWGDTRLYEFLAEAQDRFCEDTGFFVDKRTYTITTVADQAAYALSDRIIEVKEVWDGNRKLGKFRQTDKDPYNRVGVAVQFPRDIATRADTHSWQTDEETGYITFYPVPVDSGDTYTLRVWRRSIDWLGDAGIEPEVGVSYRRGLIEFACFLALTDHDFEVQDDVTAQKHFNNYEYYKRKGISAFNRLMGAKTQVRPNPAYVVED